MMMDALTMGVDRMNEKPSSADNLDPARRYRVYFRGGVPPLVVSTFALQTSSKRSTVSAEDSQSTSSPNFATSVWLPTSKRFVKISSPQRSMLVRRRLVTYPKHAIAT
jgi:hypothetical protein